MTSLCKITVPPFEILLDTWPTCIIYIGEVVEKEKLDAVDAQARKVHAHEVAPQSK